MTYYLTHVPEGVYAGQPFYNPQPLPLDPDTANFGEYVDCVTLSTLGIFSVDRTDHRKAYESQSRHRVALDNAYTSIGLNRKREHAKIAARIAHLTPEGIWPQSTKLHGDLCLERDREVIAITNTTI